MLKHLWRDITQRGNIRVKEKLSNQAVHETLHPKTSANKREEVRPSRRVPGSDDSQERHLSRLGHVHEAIQFSRCKFAERRPSHRRRWQLGRGGLAMARHTTEGKVGYNSSLKANSQLTTNGVLVILHRKKKKWVNSCINKVRKIWFQGTFHKNTN